MPPGLHTLQHTVGPEPRDQRPAVGMEPLRRVPGVKEHPLRRPAALAHPSGASRLSSSKQGRKARGIRRFPSVQASTTRGSPDTQAPVEVSRTFFRPGLPDEEVIKEEVTSVQPPTPLHSPREGSKHKARGWFRAR